jgi:Spy/CpxP family protein refolding chaperone
MSQLPLRSLALAAALLAIGSSLSAQAPGFGPGHGPAGEGHGFRGLNLTEAQQAKVKVIHESHKAAFKAKGEAAHAAHKVLAEAMANTATDAKTLKSLHDQVAAAQFELLLEHRAARQEILPLLTAEQKTQFEKQPMGMGSHGRHGRGPGFQGPRHGRPGSAAPAPEAPPVQPS